MTFKVIQQTGDSNSVLLFPLRQISSQSPFRSSVYLSLCLSKHQELYLLAAVLRVLNVPLNLMQKSLVTSLWHFWDVTKYLADETQRKATAVCP